MLENVSEEWLEETREELEAILAIPEYQRPKFPIFSTKFLYSIFGDTPSNVSNIQWYIKEICRITKINVQFNK